jgi:hypothetical protein
MSCPDKRPQDSDQAISLSLTLLSPLLDGSWFGSIWAHNEGVTSDAMTWIDDSGSQDSEALTSFYDVGRLTAPS